MSNPLRILDEHRIDLDGICELLGTADKPASQATGRRAMNRGSATPDGWTYLEHLHVGGKIVSSREAVERYLAAINGISLEPTEAVEAPPVRSKRRQGEIDRAKRELVAAGY
jgi:hypothetical protein